MIKMNGHLQIFPNAQLLWARKGERQEAAKKSLIESFKALEGELGALLWG
jgi:glutathione S-transferase